MEAITGENIKKTAAGIAIGGVLFGVFAYQSGVKKKTSIGIIALIGAVLGSTIQSEMKRKKISDY